MKKLLLFIVIVLCSFVSFGQCTTAYSVSGSGTICDSSSTVSIHLSGSDSGVTYFLCCDNGGSLTSFLPVIVGTGSSLNWTIALTGWYSGLPFKVLASTGTCTQMMSDSAVFVLGLPSVIASRTTMCRGDSVIIFDTVAGGVWTSSNPAIATVSRRGYFGGSYASIKGLSVGTATLTYSITSSCGTHFVTGDVRVDTIPPHTTISGPSTICQGSHLPFLGSIRGGIWSTSSSSIASIGMISGDLTAMAAGTAVVNYVTFTSCGNDTSFQAVTITSTSGSSASLSGPFAMHLGTTDTFSVSGATGGTWAVSPLDAASISATGIVNARGAYSPADIYYIYTSSCGAATAHTTSDFLPLDVPISNNFYVRKFEHCGSFSFVSGSAGFDSSCRLYTNFGDGSSVVSSFSPSGSGGMATFGHYYSAPGWYYIRHVLYRGSVRIDSLVDTCSVFFPPPISLSGATNYIIGVPGSISASGGGSGSWYSSDPSVAVVSYSGVVTGINPGFCTIHFNSYSGLCPASGSIDIIVISPSGAINDSFLACATSTCTGAIFYTSSDIFSVSPMVRTFFGDGTNTLRLTTSYPYIDTFSHVYGSPGTYTIKQYLLAFGSTIPIDSISYSYTYTSCRDFTISSYWDVDSNCAFNVGIDYINGTPITVAIDSNGMRIDTVSMSTGLHYSAYGAVGDIYTYRVISTGVSSCAVLVDTISSSSSSAVTKYLPMWWASAGGHDLSIFHAVGGPGRHAITGDLSVSNADTVTTAVVVLDFDARYNFQSATPSPTSVSGHTATWFFSSIAPGARPVSIHYYLEVPTGTSYWLTPGDTVRTVVKAGPTHGDLDTTDNIVIRVDTVRSSWDPNFIHVIPGGNILNGTKLRYTIHFENDGNDTAQNIHVMDTLSDNLDPSTLRIVSATAAMDISILHGGGHNIVKFDFPGIKLLDSSHHNQCTGMVIYDIKARTGLADGTNIVSHAGIYFDDNPVVLTDTAYNRILIPSLTISSPTSDTICHGGTKHFSATPYSVNTPHYQWYINTTPAGTDSAGFTTHSIGTGDVVKCKMTTIMDDTILSNSNTITIVERTLNPGTISGPSSVCPSATIAMTESVPGGAWSVTNSRATISTSGVVTGVTAGLDTIVYTVANICTSSIAVRPVTVNPVPHVSAITGPAFVCITTSVTVTDSVSTGTWSASNTHATISAAGVVSGITPGIDTLAYTETNACGTSRATHIINVIPQPYAGTITVPAILCVGASLGVTATGTGGTLYVTNSHATLTGTLITGVSAGIDTIIYTTTNSCNTATTSRVISVNPVPDAGSITGPDNACLGGSATLINPASGGVWTSSNTSVCSISSAGYITALAVGSSSIGYTVSNTCGDALVSHPFTVYGCTRIETLGNDNAVILQVFPNPNTGSFTLNGSGLGNEALDFEVRDVAARVVYSGVVHPVNGVINQTVDINKALPSGNYFIRLINAGGAVVLPFVKE